MHRLLFLSSLLIFLMPFSALAQTSTPRSEPSLLPWLERAHAETSVVAELALNFSAFDRAILYTQLAEKWAGTDSVKAKDWWQKAYDLVAFVPLQESAADRKLRISAINRVLLNANGLKLVKDETQRQRLSETLKTLAKQADGIGAGQALGNSLQSTASALIQDDPLAAKDTLLAALPLSSSLNGIDAPFQTASLSGTLNTLCARDLKIAEAFFREALTLARATRNDEILSRLSAVLSYSFRVFGDNASTNRGAANTLMDISEAVRSQVRAAVLERLSVVPTTPEEQQRYCRFILISTGVSGPGEQLPQLFVNQAAVVLPALASCQKVFDGNMPEVQFLKFLTSRESLKDSRAASVVEPQRTAETPKTVDELLALAHKQPDLKTRAGLLWQAAQLAAEQRDYKQAISLLDDMSKEERQSPATWDKWRTVYAAAGAQKYFMQKEDGEARKLLDAVPARLAGIAWIEALRNLVGIGGQRLIGTEDPYPEKRGDFKANPQETVLLLDWLTEARRKFAQTEFTTREQATSASYWLLVLYTELSPAEALSVFSDAVRVTNEESEDPQQDAQDELGFWYQINLPTRFVRESFDGIRSTITELNSKSVQIRMHLGLLEAALNFQREEAEAKKPPEKIAPPPSKKVIPTKP